VRLYDAYVQCAYPRKKEDTRHVKTAGTTNSHEFGILYCMQVQVPAISSSSCNIINHQIRQ
jgi:hypothetical protein